MNRAHKFLDSLRRLKHRSINKVWQFRINKAQKIILSTTQKSVIAGPFKGLQLVDEMVFGSHIPKLLGSYEKELHTFFKQLTKRQESHALNVCNIGSAEGYYAVGLARLDHVKNVIAYETLAQGRELTRQNAELNGVAKKITIYEECNVEALSKLLSHHHIDLLVIDIEGAELDILTESIVRQLGSTQLVVELHDFCKPNCTQLLMERFKDSHVCELINASPRTLQDFPKTIDIPPLLRTRLMDEERPQGMQWLIATPSSISNTHGN